MPAREGQALATERQGLGVVAAKAREGAGDEQGPGPGGRALGRADEQAGLALSPFAQVAADHPEPDHGLDDPRRHVDAARAR